RDRMESRGPDESGLVRHRNVVFAHRRLAIVDLEHGQQPMWSADRRALLVYNGEIYNDSEVRQKLQSEGAEFSSRSDTETVLVALRHWGERALTELRGMFALAYYDFSADTLLLARDPLGIKPLFWTRAGGEVVFASELVALLGHPSVAVDPNPVVASSYMSSLRTTLGEQTLFRGVQTVEPGRFVQFQIGNSGLEVFSKRYWTEPRINSQWSIEESIAETRRVVRDSIRAHLYADVPVHLFLSGGLDSAIIAATVAGTIRGAETWCASDPTDMGGDKHFSSRLAEELGFEHHWVEMAREAFSEEIDRYIHRIGTPLTTPNQVAIQRIARRLCTRAKVALSGEGADELFVGYSMPMLAAWDQVRAAAGDWGPSQGAAERYRAELRSFYGTDELGSALSHYLLCTSYTPTAQKSALFRPGVWDAADRDHTMMATLGSVFQDVWTPGCSGLEVALRVHRRQNLTGLLERLDSATMMSGVEGRTPFADVRVANWALSLPVHFNLSLPQHQDGGYRAAAQGNQVVTTKYLLREAFPELPDYVRNRPKVSFPLPFQEWIGSMGVDSSTLLSEWFEPDLVGQVFSNPTATWQYAWPLANLARWGERWWGNRTPRTSACTRPISQTMTSDTAVLPGGAP
ncbi:MAG: asparagine synthase (glutamine-hydrolyzing), partial [Myxococcales bacterium]|nr:asparagine synthase (glutamine-hydrolyzing) [Myxococcales bacterium]